MKRYRLLLQIGLPLLVLVLAGLITAALVLSKKPPEKQAARMPGALVETQSIFTDTHAVNVHATGTVSPAQYIPIVPQVGGRVVQLGKNFVQGGFIAKGELILKIESIDYRLAVDQSRAELAKAKLTLASTESQARIARNEWERMNGAGAQPPNPLVLYEPQLENARAAVTAAGAALRQRELNVKRTRIVAPFDGRVRSKTVDIGQVVGAGQSVASLSGTDTAEIIVPVPLADLEWVTVPRAPTDPGASAEIRLSSGKTVHTWPGRLVRSLGEVDPQSRMIRLVVAVNDPYGKTDNVRPSVPLADGLFVDVVLQGQALAQVFTIPASALRHPGAVWIMTAEKTLDIRAVTVLRRTRDRVVIKGDLADGMALVTTQLTGAAQGMRLRTTAGGR